MILIQLSKNSRSPASAVTPGQRGSRPHGTRRALCGHAVQGLGQRRQTDTAEEEVHVVRVPHHAERDSHRQALRLFGCREPSLLMCLQIGPRREDERPRACTTRRRLR